MHDPRDGGDDRRPLGGEDVLPLVGVAGAAGAEARAVAAERVGALNGEDAADRRRDGGGGGGGGGAGAVTWSESRPEACAVRRSFAPRGPVACSLAA